MSKKLIALTLAVAFALPFVAPAQAATVEELQALINSLNQQITALQQQLASLTGGSASTGTYCFTTDLKKGMTSNDVKNLQIVLNKDAATQVATTGAGSPGNETTYFGALTEAAVKKYQAANGISPVSGYVGPLTRASLNAKYCNPVTPPTTAPSETTTTTIVAPAYGTLSVTSYPVSNPQTTWYGAQTYEAVAGQYKATGSDITIKKVAVTITSDAAAFPWQAFTSISLWDGATKLAELPVTQANAIENTFARIYTFNISGFNWVIPNGQQKVLTVKITPVANPPSTVTGSGFWKFELLKDVVYTDTAGVTYSTVTGSVITLDNITLSSSQTATFTVTAASDNPKKGNVIGSTSATTRIEVLKFNVRNNSDINATFNSGIIVVTSTHPTTTVSVELWDGGTQIAAAAPDAFGTSTWSNFTLPIAANTTKTLTVKAVIAQLASGYTGGDTVKIYRGPELSGIDANSNVADADGSTVVGEEQTIYLAGPIVSLASTNFTVSGTTDHPKSMGSAKIVFNITAGGTNDVYIETAGSATSTVTPSIAAASGTIATGFTCTSGATATSTGWRITAGNTATCELNTTIQLTSTSTGLNYQVAAKQIKWGTNGTSYPNTYTGNLADFKTSQEYMAY